MNYCYECANYRHVEGLYDEKYVKSLSNKQLDKMHDDVEYLDYLEYCDEDYTRECQFSKRACGHFCSRE